MNTQTFKQLQLGDIVKHKIGTKLYVVTGNYSDRVTAARTVDIVNPDEWDLIQKAKADENLES